MNRLGLDNNYFDTMRSRSKRKMDDASERELADLQGHLSEFELEQRATETLGRLPSDKRVAFIEALVKQLKTDTAKPSRADKQTHSDEVEED